MSPVEGSHAAEKRVQDLWQELSPEAQSLIGRVIEIEKAKLHMSLPRGINEELVRKIKEVVR